MIKAGNARNGGRVCLFWTTENKLEQKKAVTLEKSLTPTGLVWNTNMAAVTSCENALFALFFTRLYSLSNL